MPEEGKKATFIKTVYKENTNIEELLNLEKVAETKRQDKLDYDKYILGNSIYIETEEQQSSVKEYENGSNIADLLSKEYDNDSDDTLNSLLNVITLQQEQITLLTNIIKSYNKCNKM